MRTFLHRHKWVIIGAVLFYAGGSLQWEPVYWVGAGLLAWRLIAWFFRTRFGRWCWNA